MERDTSIYDQMYANKALYETAFGDDPGLLRFVEILCEKLKPGSSVLDLGCGTGEPVASTLSRRGHRVHGLDTDANLIAACRLAVPKATFEQLDFMKYQPKGNAPFDAVINSMSLFCLNRAEIEKLATHWSKWVKPGGYVGIGTMCAEDVAKTFPQTTNRSDQLPGHLVLDQPGGRCAENIKWMFMGSEERLTLFTRNGWNALLTEKGFDVLYARTELHTPPNKSQCLPAWHYWIIAMKRKQG